MFCCCCLCWKKKKGHLVSRDELGRPSTALGHRKTTFSADQRKETKMDGNTANRKTLVKEQEVEKKKKKKKRPSTKIAKVGSERFPFEVDDLDRAPYEAYKDINIFLELYAKLIGKTKATLSIYDPYFCDGSIKKHFASLGYHNVYNVKEDFYKRIKNNSTPSFDVLITNPRTLPIILKS